MGQQMLPHQGARLSSDQGHQVCGLELRICGLPEPLWGRVPVWRKEFMLWQECLPGPSMMWNSSASPWPDAERAVALFGASRLRLHGRSQQVTCTCGGICQK